MAKAIMLINAEVGSEVDVLNTVKIIPEVKENHMVYGVYDIIIIVEAATMQELKDVISLKIRRIENVRSTITMIVL